MTLQLGPWAPVRGPLGFISNQPWEAEGLVRVLTEDGLGTSLVVGPVVFCVSCSCAGPGAAAQEARTAEEREEVLGWQHSEVRCWTDCGPVILEHRKASQALSTECHQH
jgi:hypothetical protein